MQIFGTRDGDFLSGDQHNDIIRGGPGDDMIDGGPGADLLNGGRGVDTFVFANDGVDTVRDFTPGRDLAQVFVGGYVDSGDLEDGHWQEWVLSVGGRRSPDSDAFTVIYNPKNGKAFIDHDGDGADEAVQFARFDAGLWVSRDDFLLS